MGKSGEERRREGKRDYEIWDINRVREEQRYWGRKGRKKNRGEDSRRERMRVDGRGGIHRK